MTDREIREQPINELAETRQRVVELQASETQREWAEEGQRQALAEALRATHALKESEERFRSIFETVNDIIAYIDPHGKILNVNKRVEDLLGYTRDEIVGKNFTELVVLGPEDLPRIVKLFRDTTREGQVVDILELELRHKNGQRAFMEVSTRFIKKNGQVDGVVCIFRDITQRKRAEESLKESEEKFRTIFETVNDIIAYIDKHGKILNTNKRLEDILGYTRAEIIGKNFTELVVLGPEDLPRIVKLFRDTTREGQAVGILELELRHKNGQRALMEVSTRFIKKNGQVDGVVCIFRDITQRRRAEETIKHLAYHDDLTGLPNRRLFNDRLSLAMAHARRNQQKLAVMLLDLDRFKDVNDTLGHGVGDQLLQVVSERLTSLLRTGDTVARMGGDEFMLLLPEIAQVEGAAEVAQKILEALREPFGFDGHELHITTSIGIALYPDDGKNGDALMKNADIAMYRAKEQGRNNYRRYSYTV